jgi:hypothetical protein
VCGHRIRAADRINIVSFQPLQAGFDGIDDVAARGALFGAVGAHRLGVFGREHDVLAAIAQHLAEYGLGAAHSGIDVGSVEQRDAEIDGLVDHLSRGLEIGALAKIIAAKTDGRDAQAGAAEIADFHGSAL